jgi:release factor glutamine methyltransferase
MSVRDLLKDARAQCEAANIARIDAELILAHVLGTDRMQLHAIAFDVTAQHLETFQDLLAERISGVPVQYLIGEAPFRYLTFDVGPGVLIPRPETELLVDAALVEIERIQSSVGYKVGSPTSVIDLGSGSGAIAISIADEARNRGLKTLVVAVEKEEAALRWLKQNIAKHDVDVRVVEGDLSQLLLGVRADIVVANPPYIPESVSLPDLVLKYEPREALFGGDLLGLEAPKRFIDGAKRMLKAGGLLVLEHFETHSDPLERYLHDDFFEILHFTDLNTRPRWITARRKG